jgi:hypothetical protein
MASFEARMNGRGRFIRTSANAQELSGRGLFASNFAHVRRRTFPCARQARQLSTCVQSIIDWEPSRRSCDNVRQGPDRVPAPPTSTLDSTGFPQNDREHHLDIALRN